MRAGAKCPVGEGMTRVRCHTDLCVPHRRGGQTSIRTGFKAATSFTVSGPSRMSLRTCSSVGETSQGITQSVVSIKLPYRVTYGEVLRVVGSGTILGDWSADCGLQLTWTEGDVWTAEVPITAGQYEFKCVVYNATTKSVTRWEDGGNRILNITDELGTWDVSCQWGATKSMTQAFTPATLAIPPKPDAPELETEMVTPKEVTLAVDESLQTFSVLSEAPADSVKVDAGTSRVDEAVVAGAFGVSTNTSMQVGNDDDISLPAGGNASLLLLATVAAAGAVVAVAFLAPSSLDKSVLGARTNEAVSPTLEQSNSAGAQVSAQVQSQLAALAGHVSAVQAQVPTVQPVVQAKMVSMQGSSADTLALLQPAMRSGASSS